MVLRPLCTLLMMHFGLQVRGYGQADFIFTDGGDRSFSYLVEEGKRFHNPEPGDGTLYKISDEFVSRVGPDYIQTYNFPSVYGSLLRLELWPEFILKKGPNWEAEEFTLYRLHCLIHSAIAIKKNTDYPRWHQRTGNHHLFRLFKGEENLWGARAKSARIEAYAYNNSYNSNASSDVENRYWHSFEGTLTMLTPIDQGVVFQGYNPMLFGWFVGGFMTVDENGKSSLILKARREEEKSVAGASLTGVPLHIVVRDNGHDYEVYVNGRLMLSHTLDRDPARKDELEDQFKKDGVRENDMTNNSFRWGIYVGNNDIANDGLVMWSGVEIDGKSRASPPTCQYTTTGFMMPDKVPGLGPTFSVEFDMTLLQHNHWGRSNIFWLGDVVEDLHGSKILGMWIEGNTDSDATLHAEWGQTCGCTGAPGLVKVGKKIKVKIEFATGSNVRLTADGVEVCTGFHPGESFWIPAVPMSLWLSAPLVETADVCLSSLKWDSSIDQADPQCCNGWSKDKTCCPLSCGKCGGSGCSSRPGGNLCCTGGVTDTGNSCADSPAPCVMEESASQCPGRPAESDDLDKSVHVCDTVAPSFAPSRPPSLAPTPVPPTPLPTRPPSFAPTPTPPTFAPSAAPTNEGDTWAPTAAPTSGGPSWPPTRAPTQGKEVDGAVTRQSCGLVLLLASVVLHIGEFMKS